MRKILSLINTKNVLEKISRECNWFDKYNALDPQVRDLLESCLSISPKDRPLPNEILQHVAFQANLEANLYVRPPAPLSPLLQCPLKQIYYWWQLAGGDVLADLKSEGLIRNEAPILTMPK